MKCFLVSAGVATVTRRHPLYRECVTLRVLTHRWLIGRLEGVALRQRVDLDTVMLTAVEEMALHGDRIFRTRQRRAHDARVRAGLAVAVPIRRSA
jgi:hypothetical protein